MAARAVAARRGEAGAGQRGLGKRRRGCWGGTWCEEWQRGAVGARHMAGKGRRGGERRGNKAEGLEVDEEDLVAISQKCRDSTIKPS
jgi:hypothetical protein